MKKKTHPDRLRGRSILFRGASRRRQRPVGFYAGKIVRVTRGTRVPIKRILIERVNGERLRLFPEEWTGDGLGIYYYKRARPVAEIDAILAAKDKEVTA